MRDISDELLYALNLPLPPAFGLCQDNGATYKVPDFFGYESPSTRWILAILTNKSSLKRLIKSGHNYEAVFSRYYQIPDRPIEIMGSDYTLETPAYHQQSVLYLTPLALALYMKQLSAVEMILELKSDNGHKIVHPNEACFVQTVFKKGDKRMTNELSNTFPIIIAIRRCFFEGMALLIENGFTPQKQFTIIYRKSFRESVCLFRDVLDYIVDLLHKKPGLNVTKMMKTMLDPSVGLTTLDIFVFDIELDNHSNWDYVSIFRRICRIGYGTKYFIEESATQVLNVLDQIQQVGYFGGVECLKIYYNGEMPDYHQHSLSQSAILELKSERLSLIMEKIPTIIKASRGDLFKLDPTELKERINYDYQSCIGILFLWYQRCLNQERCCHYAKLGFLLSKIMLNTRVVEEFFEKTDKDLSIIFSEWAQESLKPKTIYNFRIRMQDYILFTDHLCISFINSYGEAPSTLIHAPMLRGKRPENSPVVRDLISTQCLNMTDTSVSQENVNQNNQKPNNVTLNVFDADTNLSMKFIPANRLRNFSLNNMLDPDLDRHSRRHSLNKVSSNTKSIPNNSNSLENVTDKTINDGNNNLLYSTGISRTNTDIKSPTEDTCEQSIVTTPPTDLPFRKNIPKDFRKKSKTKPIQRKFFNTSNSNPETSLNFDGNVQQRLQRLLTSKYHDFSLPQKTEKIPLKYLKEKIQKYKSVDEIIKILQKKESTQLDCLYNNLNAHSMVNIMERLSYHTMVSNSKSSHNEFSQVFRSKT